MADPTLPMDAAAFRIHPLAVAVARFGAIQHLTAADPGLGFAGAWRLVHDKAPAGEVGRRFCEAHPDLAAGVAEGGVWADVLAWIEAHPELIRILVSIILALVAL